MSVESAPLRFLLIASESAAAAAVANTLEAAFGTSVEIASSLEISQNALRARTFDIILLEEAVSREHPHDLDTIYDLAESAVILEINFGLLNLPRVLRQVRRAHQQQAATATRHQLAARRTMQMDLRGALAGLRLQSEIALRASGPELSFHLTNLIQLAESIAWQVQIAGTTPPPADDLHQTEETCPASS